MPVKSAKELKERNLAEEWADGVDGRRKPPPTAAERKLERLTEGIPKTWTAKSRKGIGGKKGMRHKSTIAVKEFMLSILDNPKYRKSLERRILAGALPQIELFMLTKTLGKPVEEINVTANVPLFSMPAAFVLREDEDVIEADVAPQQLGPGVDTISAPYDEEAIEGEVVTPQLGPGGGDAE